MVEISKKIYKTKEFELQELENKEVLEKTSLIINDTASGEKLEECIGKMFQDIRKKVYQEIGGSIIQMDTKSVIFEKITTNTHTEKFLLFFWPREKTEYSITAKIEVMVKYIKL